MSRIGKLPINVPTGVKIDINGKSISVSGKLGSLNSKINENVKIDYNNENKQIMVHPNSDSRSSKAMNGLYRSIINNMVLGVSHGFSKNLEIHGVGYKASITDKNLTLSLGFSHDIIYMVPEEINIVCEKPTFIKISGADKQKVGQIAANIRQFRPPEPYKGKGIRYENEKIQRKVGKKK
ncbi:MAG: 50S ribosomal protein L6 [Rickettsiales bacterium]|nr:MAG: 50S ribosomal protein L6 [Rickettsiales bacterium]